MNWRETIEALGNLDLADLSVESAGSWPMWGKVAAAALVFGLVAGAGYWWFAAPAGERLELAQARESELRGAYRQKAAQSAALAADPASRTALETAAAALFGLLPGDGEVADLLDDITAAAAHNGLVVRSVDLKPERRAGFYAALPMELSVEGGYHDFAAFVSRVASLPRLVTLHDFDLESLGGPSQEPPVARAGSEGRVKSRARRKRREMCRWRPAPGARKTTCACEYWSGYTGA